MPPIVRRGRTSEPSTPQIISRVIAIVGGLLLLPLDFLVAFGFDQWRTRMDCSQTALGSGCYESEFGLSLLLLMLFFIPLWLVIMALCLPRGHDGWKNWWPLIIFTLLPVVFIVALAMTMSF